MQSEKAGISTAVDVEVSARLDAFCGKIHRNRAEVMRGLLYALLIGGKQFIFDEWRLIVDGQPRPKPRPQTPHVHIARDGIMRVMRLSGTRTVRELKQVTNSRRVTNGDWDKALQRLVTAGELRITLERTASGRTRRVVTLLSAR